MGFMDRLKQDAAAIKAERETPPGRRYELKMISADCNMLLFGCVGLAIWFPPLIYAVAIGHLVVNCLSSPLKWFWFVSTAITTSIASFVVFSGTYLVQRYYFGIPENIVVDQLGGDWMLYTAIAIVTGGILSVIFSHPGGVGQLIEHKDGAETNAR